MPASLPHRATGVSAVSSVPAAMPIVVGGLRRIAVPLMERFKVEYADPLFRLPMTFTEIFPVGVLV
jgi:hypothetical protein